MNRVGHHGGCSAGLRDVDDRATVYRPRILLAEDDDDFRALLVLWLEADGYRVAATATGGALLARLGAMLRSMDPPAVVVADDRMPGLLGSRALRSMREQGWSIPFVLITAFGTDELVAEAEAMGVTVLKKPFEIDDFRTLVGWLVPKVGTQVCIACGSTDDIRAMADRGSASFCKTCRALIENVDPPGELGGES